MSKKVSHRKGFLFAMKRVLSVQDISCLGKCSLTVALPIISAAGLEGAILPTAVLSVHTWFKSFTFHDLTGEIEPIMSGGILAAHNAVFDLGVLKKCLADYDIVWKECISYLCTVQVGRKLLPDISHRLNDMCRYYQIELDHHQADSDSHACAEILLRYLQAGIRISDHKGIWRFR